MKKSAGEIAEALFGKLWENYSSRVSYARTYAGLVYKKGGKLVIDHIAFRTLNTHTGEQPEGIQAIQHILECCGYKRAGKYSFPERKLSAVHLEHSNPAFPKIFISQLEVELLPEWAQNLIRQTVRETPYNLSDSGLELLGRLKTDGQLNTEAAEILVDNLVQYFRRPWIAPSKETVLKINDVSQYASWVLLHGNSVNHFAAYTNFQQVKEWPDLETTSRYLANAGIPMKQSIEGKPGNKLRQTATLAVKEEAEVQGDDGIEKIPWTYAYFELTQRNLIKQNGVRKIFSGFLGEQARHLFDMTKTLEN